MIRERLSESKSFIIAFSLHFGEPDQPQTSPTTSEFPPHPCAPSRCRCVAACHMIMVEGMADDRPSFACLAFCCVTEEIPGMAATDPKSDRKSAENVKLSRSPCCSSVVTLHVGLSSIIVFVTSARAHGRFGVFPQSHVFELVRPRCRRAKRHFSSNQFKLEQTEILLFVLCF